MFLPAPRCPSCKRAPLFETLLKVYDACPSCGANLGAHDAGDGPVFFAITIVGFLVMVSAGIVEYHFAPALWVHAALWIPLVIWGSLFCLRAFKAHLIALEYTLREKK